jgi:hypothetical protein
LPAIPGDSSYPNRRLSNIIRINVSGGLFGPWSPANFGEECSKEIKAMKTTTKKMKTKTIALSLGLILVAGGLYAADLSRGRGN